VKKFFSTLETVNSAIFDDDIKLVLVKYFHKVFINLDVAHVPNLISDIKANKQSAILTEAFIKALDRDETLIGNALFYAAKECDNDRLKIIDDFLEELHPAVKRGQIIFAIKSLQDYLTNNLDDASSTDYYREIAFNLHDLQAMVEK
jgi:hypothetical protein